MCTWDHMRRCTFYNIHTFSLHVCRLETAISKKIANPSLCYRMASSCHFIFWNVPLWTPELPCENSIYLQTAMLRGPHIIVGKKSFPMEHSGYPPKAWGTNDSILHCLKWPRHKLSIMQWLLPTPCDAQKPPAKTYLSPLPAKIKRRMYNKIAVVL